MTKSNAALRLPAIENGNVALGSWPAKVATGGRTRRPKNRDVRPREYLTHSEIEALMKAAKGNRYGHRDATLIEVASRHGLRVAELTDLKWDQIDFNRAELAVRRVKRGSAAIHQVAGRELRMLRQLRREQTPASVFVFVTERGAPFSKRAVHAMVARAGVTAGIPFPVHPHMLRHATGYKFANDGVSPIVIQRYLGHRSIQHTLRYCELSSNQFKNLWDD